jgi:hypothetical protein
MTRTAYRLAADTCPLVGEVGSRAIRDRQLPISVFTLAKWETSDLACASREGGRGDRSVKHPPPHPSPTRGEGVAWGSLPKTPSALLVLATLLGAILIAAPVQTFAADPRFPDWPCVQIKVPEISVAAVWTGPPIDAVRGQWQSEAKVAELVPRLAARRTPLEAAEKLVAEFLGSPAERAQNAKLLFAGLFETLAHERSEVMDGIERFARKQKGVVDKIRAKTAELHRLQDANADPGKVDDLASQLDWDIRVYEDEKKTVSYVCEVPQLIERRLFALSRMIQQALE